ncbi:PaaI family thioesterase [Snodgrassella sp. B3882]|uniref:PaaI family thioesterase n=1 Tax=Snodgrassella sp. B3882 TaxID=2818037 RepID=UPI00226AB181|nr:PaaI family thioesterase [Snodgrassella sp. B3882]MCX8745064.1 PaaI family thioesterase [Snodgrassella sp. B3882]
MPANNKVFQALFHHLLQLPHCQWLGIYGDNSTDQPVISIPWREELIADKRSGNLHGGVITTLIDMASAGALAAKLTDFENTATLDMRVDYLRPVCKNLPVHVRAHCYRLEGQIAYIRSHCFQEDEQDPFALGMTTFMHTPLTIAEKQAIHEYMQQELAK